MCLSFLPNDNGIFIVSENWGDFPGGSDSKESTCNAGNVGSIPGLGRPPGEGNGNPLQYSCLENPLDRGAWWATVHGVARVGYDWATDTQRLTHRLLQCRCLAKSWWTEMLICFRLLGRPYLFSRRNWNKARLCFFSLEGHCVWKKKFYFSTFEPFVKITWTTLLRLEFIACISVILTDNIHSL